IVAFGIVSDIQIKLVDKRNLYLLYGHIGKIISLLHKLNQSFACKKVACISYMGRCHSDFQFVLVVIFVEKRDNCLFLFLMPQKNVSQLFRGYMPVNAHEFVIAVSYTHLRAHETRHDLVCRLLLEKKK